MPLTTRLVQQAQQHESFSTLRNQNFQAFLAVFALNLRKDLAFCGCQ